MRFFKKYEDIIDIRDITDRVEHLECLLGNEEGTDEGWKGTDDEWDEFSELQWVLSNLKGNGGDEEWRGDYYPNPLIAGDNFEDYVMDMLSDIGVLPEEIPYYVVIDTKATAENIRVDYDSIEVNGFEYWYRNS